MTKNFKNRIRDWAVIQKGNLLMDLMNLVNIPSVSIPDLTDPPFGQECQNALNWMLKKGESLGFIGTSYDGYAGSLSLHGEEKENPNLVTGIWCHLDVVPAGEGWQTPPFHAIYQDGLVTGRGSQDNKSAAVMGLYVLKGLKELEISLKHPAALYFGLSEEHGMEDLDYYLTHFTPPGLSLIADCGFPACYGEKGSLTVTFSTQPVLQLQVKNLSAGIADNIIPGSASASLELNGKEYHLTTQGHGGHSAFPEGTKNAIVPLLKQILDLEELSPETVQTLQPLFLLAASTNGAAAGIAKKDSQYGNLTSCASILKWENNIWKLTCNIRYPHSMSKHLLLENLADFQKKSGLTMNIDKHLPSFGFSPDDPVIQKLTEVYNQETGAVSSQYAMAGGTYAAKLPNAIPFGISFPDKSAIYNKFPRGHGDYHQPDESVEVDRIIRALQIYLIALAEIDEMR